MDDNDDAWSAEPDESFKTPKLNSAASFDSLATPTSMNQADEEPTPQQSSYSKGPENGKRDSSSDTEEAVSGLGRALPRLNLEAVIDAEAGPRHTQHVNGNGSSSRQSDEDSEPATARPIPSSRTSSFSQLSPDLHILASMYRPDETQLTVADGTGYFTDISLSTPTMEQFGHQNSSQHWGNSESSKQKGKGKGKEVFNWSSRAGAEHADTAPYTSRPVQSRQHSSGKGFVHRKTASDASHMVMEPDTTVASTSKRASWMSNAAAFASSPTPSHDPATIQADVDFDNYRPRASSSSSSVADSVGTAGEAPDSDYEDARSKSHSRQGSRRPSISEVPVITKRLSSFAPIPSLKATPSQTDLSSSATENGHTESGSVVRKPQRQDTATTIKGSDGMSRDSSSQSASSSASGSSTGPHSAPASRTPSSGATTYSVAMAVTNSQSFEQHRKENAKWLKKRKKGRPTPLDKVISKTRPHDLPPKEREEDRKHLREFEEMMLASKQAAKKKAAARQEKRKAKEVASTQALHTWEKEILPNWKSVLRKDELRQIWWSGTMPPRYRARFWQSCIGNSLVLGKTSYAKALALARSLQANGRFSIEITKSIEADVKHILPSTRLFQEGCPLHSDIIELLQAHCVFWKNDKPVYRSGTSYIAGMLLVCMPAQDAFLCLVNLVNKSLLKTFYYGTQDDIEAYYRVFNTLLADQMPTVYRNFVSHDIRPSLYLQDWVTTLFSRHLGLDSATRAWDIYVLEGDQFLFRLALGLLHILKARLFNPDHEELTELFQGRDKGARAIVARETGKPESDVEPWEAYEEMGATEELIFEVVRSMEWKEATFQRLLARELPDDG